MAKNNVRDWDVVAANNTDLAGIGIQGTNAVSNFDGGLRELMKQIADVDEGVQPLNDTFTVCDPVDTTKRVRIDAGTVATATTRVLTMPNADVTISAFAATLLDDAADSNMRTTLGLGTAATQNTGTSGANVPLLNGINTWSAGQTFTSPVTVGNSTSIVRDVNNDVLNIYGGTTAGANIELYGGAHATLANRTFYDADVHNFRNISGGTPTLQSGGNTVWHAGNDGAGSGLDADLLDGLNTASGAVASTIMTRDGSADTAVRNLTATYVDSARVDTPQISYASSLIIGDGGTEDFRFNADAFLSNGLTVTKTAITDTGTGLSFQRAGIIWASREGAASTFLNRDTSDGTVVQFGRSKTAVGSISVTTTATAYNTSSSKTLKENWRDFDAGSIIDSLDAWLFDWKNGNGSAYGVLAQDAINAFPDAITSDSNPDLWSVDYSKYVPLLLREVKELRKRLAVLEVA